MKKDIFVVLTSLSMIVTGHSASVSVLALNSTQAVMDNTGTALSSGVGNVNGDGDLFEIGYFSTDTATFSGTWIALTGPSSNNPTLVTTIGDVASQDGSTFVPNGLFSTEVKFDDTVANTTNDLPANGTQLAIRFYDGSTRAGSNFNTVTSSDSTWQFKSIASPAPTPSPTLNFDSGSITLVWQDNTNPFRTTIVPEPSTTMTLGLGGLVLLLRRRR